MSVLYKLMACHMLGDYVLQSDYLARTKGENWWHLLAHCITYTVPFALAFGIDVRIAALFASHLIVDAQKARWNCIGYVQDQLSHIVTLAFLYGWEAVA